MALPPELRQPTLTQTLGWIFRPVPFAESAWRRYGDMFTVRLGPIGRMTFVADPASIKQIFTAGPDQLGTGTGSSPLGPVVGPNSVLTVQGSEHLRHRKLLLPSFHGERMRAYGDLIAEITAASIDSWPADRAFSLHRRTQAITLDVILQAVFGIAVGPGLARLRDLLTDFLAMSQSPRLLVPALRKRELRSVPGKIGVLLGRVDHALYEEIAHRRLAEDLHERSDILSMMVGARFDDGSEMSDSELRDELVTLLLAGHETTATSLAWTFERLLRTPDAFARLEAEIDETGGGPYLDAVISETLRDRPVIPNVARVLNRPMELGGFEFPEGWRLAPSIWLVNHHPAAYDEPTVFRPERFLDRDPDTYAWIPFGGGVRRCLGASFALYEMRVVIREVLSRARLVPSSVEDEDEAVRRRNITFAPAHGARVRITERRPPRAAVAAAA